VSVIRLVKAPQLFFVTVVAYATSATNGVIIVNAATVVTVTVTAVVYRVH
jgi:hypothetical protein